MECFEPQSAVRALLSTVVSSFTRKLSIVFGCAAMVVAVGAVTEQPSHDTPTISHQNIFGDFNGDGVVDVIRQPTSSSKAVEMLLYSDNDRSMNIDYQWAADELDVRWGGEHSRLVPGDFDGNGRDDLFVQSIVDSSHALLLSDINGQFREVFTRVDEALLDASVTGQHRALAAGDFNGDGIDDLLIRSMRKRDAVSLVVFDDTTSPAQSGSWAFDELNLEWRLEKARAEIGVFSGQDADGRYSQDILLISSNENGKATLATVSINRSLEPGLLDRLATDIEFDQIASTEIADADGDGIDEITLLNVDGEVLAVFTAGQDGRLKRTKHPRLHRNEFADAEVSEQTDATSKQAKSQFVRAAPPPASDAAGTLPADLSVQNGAAIYRIPIEVPPGRNGMAPDLALEYNSRYPNGVMGVGWKISGLSSIERCNASVARDTQSMPVAWSNEDRLCLDGKRLKLVAGTRGESGSTYRTELDEYARITLNGNSTSATSSLVYEARNGRILTYGGTEDSVFERSGFGSNEPLKWALSKVEDRHGNYMEFKYSIGTPTGIPSTHRISEITYTLPDTGTKRFVKFDYEFFNRSDSIQTFISGTKRTIPQRLISIKTYVGTDVVRTYTPHYITSSATHRSLVEYIQLCATNADGESCLPANKFTYDQDAPSFTVHDDGYSGMASGPIYQADYPAADLNGDGRDDLIDLNDGFVRVWWGTETGFSDAESIDFGDIAISSDAKISEKPTLDWNQDGRMDFTFPLAGLTTGDVPIGPTSISLLGVEQGNVDTNGSYTVDWPWDFQAFPDVSFRVHERLLGGDTEIIPIEPPATGGNAPTALFRENMPDESSFFYQVQACNLGGACSELNADSPRVRVNIVLGGVSSDCAEECDQPVSVASAQATSQLGVLWFDEAGVPHVEETNIDIDLSVDFASYYTLDVNGDGREDVVSRSEGFWKTYLRSPNTDELTFVFNGSVEVDNDQAAQVIDYNGDGRFDLLLERPPFVGATTFNRVLLSQGTSFSVIDSALQNSSVSEDVGAFATKPLVADVNGDGLTDAVINSTGNENLIYLPGTGNGWPFANQQLLSPPPNTPGGEYLTFAVRVLDVDGDGDLDLLRPTTPAFAFQPDPVNLTHAYHWEVVPFDENGFDESLKYNFTDTSGPGLILGSWTFADIMGDGIVDVIATEGGQLLGDSSVPPIVVTNSVGESDVLVEITDGFGARQEIDYASINDTSVHHLTTDLVSDDPSSYPNRSFTGAFKVVSEVRTSHGATEPTEGKDTTATRYEYWNARIDREGRGFLGFEKILEEQVDAQISTETLYYLSFPRTGRPKQSTTFISGEDVASGEFISQTNFTWADVVSAELVNPAEERCFWDEELEEYICFSPTPESTYPAAWSVYLSNSVQIRKEPSAAYANAGTISTTNVVDLYGNLTHRTTTIDDNHSRVTRALDQVVDADAANWWVNKINRTKITSAIDVKMEPFPTTSDWSGPEEGPKSNQSIRLLTRTYYENGAAGCDATHRDACEIRIDPDDTGDPEITDGGVEEQVIKIVYDAYGNATSTTISPGANVPVGNTFANRSASADFNSDDGEYYFWNSRQNALGHTTTGNRSKSYGLLTSVTSPNLSTVNYKYDAFGRITEIDIPTAAKQVIEYLLCDGELSCPDLAVMKVSVSQDQQSNLSLYYDIAGREVLNAYDGFLADSLTKTKTDYDYLGRLAAVSEPYSGESAAHSSTFSMFDDLHRPRKLLTPSGEERTFTYGALQTTIQRVAEDFLPVEDGTITNTYKFNTLGWLQSSTDAISKISHYRQDSLGNMVLTKDTGNNTTQMSFDKRGRQIELLDPNNGGWTYLYDAVDQQKEIRRVHSSTAYDVIALDYDALGRTTKRTETIVGQSAQQVGEWYYDTNPHGSGDIYESDPDSNYLGRMSRVVGMGRSDGYEKTYAYDQYSRLVRSRSRFDVGGSLQTLDNQLGYDEFGRLDKLTYPTDYSVDFDYNTKGYLTSETDADGDTLRNITGYSVRDQITAQTFGDAGKVTGSYTYSPATGLSTGMAANCTGVSCDQAVLQDLNYTYDEFNLLRTREKLSLAPAAKETFTDYDKLFRLKSSTVSLGDNDVVTYANTYSNSGNILSKGDFASQYFYLGLRNAGPNAVTDVSLTGGKGQLSYAYDLHGNMTSVTPVGAATIDYKKSITYTLMNKPETITSQDKYVEAFSYSPDDIRWKQHSYQVTGSTPSRTTYYVDGLYELIEHKNSDGNVVTEKRHHVGDYLVHTELSSVDSDQDGVEDWQDNCRNISNPNQVDANGDGFGNRCDADLNDDGIVNFVDLSIFQGLFLTTGSIADFNEDGIVNFVDLSIFSNLFLMAPGPGAVGKFTEGDKYLLTDNLGSVDTVVTEDGEILEQFGYTPFGKRTGANWVSSVANIQNPGFGNAESSTTTSGFTGHEHLDSSGWIHMGGRAYDPDLGRFTAADPIISGLGNGQSLNAYSYVWNSPLNGTDPSGYAADGGGGCGGGVFCSIVNTVVSVFRSIIGAKDLTIEQVNFKWDVSRTAPQENTGQQTINTTHVNADNPESGTASDVAKHVVLGAIDNTFEAIFEGGVPLPSGISLPSPQEMCGGCEVDLPLPEPDTNEGQLGRDLSTAVPWIIAIRSGRLSNRQIKSLLDRFGSRGRVPKKRGPKTDPNAPHNKKIREVGDQIEAEGGTVLAGGGRLKERLIPTPGGHKSGRRPDVLYEDCNGNLCGVNVGKTKANGSPVKRELEALDDLNGAGLPTTFERYD